MWYGESSGSNVHSGTCSIVNGTGTWVLQKKCIGVFYTDYIGSIVCMTLYAYAVCNMILLSNGSANIIMYISIIALIIRET